MSNFTIDAVIQRVVTKPVLCPGISEKEAREIYNGLCRFLGDTMAKGKGVTIPGFGHFGFTRQETHSGTWGMKTTVRPSFTLHPTYRARYGLSPAVQSNKAVAGTPTLLLNTSSIAVDTGSSLAQVNGVVKDIVRTIGEMVAESGNAYLDMAICCITIKGGKYSAAWSNHFKERIDVLDIDINTTNSSPKAAWKAARIRKKQQRQKEASAVQAAHPPKDPTDDASQLRELRIALESGLQKQREPSNASMPGKKETGTGTDGTVVGSGVASHTRPAVSVVEAVEHKGQVVAGYNDRRAGLVEAYVDEQLSPADMVKQRAKTHYHKVKTLSMRSPPKHGIDSKDLHEHLAIQNKRLEEERNRDLERERECARAMEEDYQRRRANQSKHHQQLVDAGMYNKQVSAEMFFTQPERVNAMGNIFDSREKATYPPDVQFLKRQMEEKRQQQLDQRVRGLEYEKKFNTIMGEYSRVVEEAEKKEKVTKQIKASVDLEHQMQEKLKWKLKDLQHNFDDAGGNLFYKRKNISELIRDEREERASYKQRLREELKRASEESRLLRESRGSMRRAQCSEEREKAQKLWQEAQKEKEDAIMNRKQQQLALRKELDDQVNQKQTRQQREKERNPQYTSIFRDENDEMGC